MEDRNLVSGRSCFQYIQYISTSVGSNSSFYSSSPCLFLVFERALARRDRDPFVVCGIIINGTVVQH